MRVKIILILVALFVGGAFFSVPIAANNSVVWHAEDGKIFLIDKFENTVCFYAPPGFFGKDFSGDTVLSIEIPGEIELLGFNRRDKGRGMTKLRPSDETAGIDRYEVNVGKPYSNGSTWVKAHFIPKRLLEKDAVLKWWWKTDKMQETAQELKIALLPEMKEIAQPKRLSVMLWSCWNADIDPKYLHHVVRLLQYTGINMATYTHYRGKPEQWKQAGSEEAGIDINIGTGVIGGHKKYLNKGDPKNHPSNRPFQGYEGKWRIGSGY